jgi:non-canonical purine NTP pyrophosphatase (RdgB/HAM1 family)
VSGPTVVVLATRNAGKAREFDRLLEGAFDLRTLRADIALPEETGETFAENARLKAETVFAALGGSTAVLADDSGLQVTALRGAPGVQSARYAGENARDEENVQKLLAELRGRGDRTARFLPLGAATGLATIRSSSLWGGRRPSRRPIPLAKIRCRIGGRPQGLCSRACGKPRS